MVMEQGNGQLSDPATGRHGRTDQGAARFDESGGGENLPRRDGSDGGFAGCSGDRVLFELPDCERIEPTPAQLKILDMIALHEDQALTGRLQQYGFARVVLRRMIEADLVTCIAYGPARYRLTSMGRLVRARGAR